MITVDDVELRAGSRLLVEHASFRIAPGDRVGLVGRNGAGKTTLTKVLAGELLPAAGRVTRTGTIGYLPQDPRTGDLTASAGDRVLSARGLDGLAAELAQAGAALAAAAEPAPLLRRYGELEERFSALDGYRAQSDAARVCASLGLPERVLSQPLGTLSGGQRRRVELARILFAEATTLLLDEPTNHLDADSVSWLREFLRGYPGGLLVISHDTGLLDHVCTRVLHLDPARAAVDGYAMGWSAYLKTRDDEERRRRRERVNAERRIDALSAQADRMRGSSARRARAAHSLDRRAERLSAGMTQVRRSERVARLRFPEPAPCGRVPLSATGLAKGFGSLEVFRGVDMAVERGSRTVVLGLNGAGKTTLLRLLAGVERPDAGEVSPGHGLRLGYYAQEHETLEAARSVLDNLRSASPDTGEQQLRGLAGAFLLGGDMVDQPAGTLSGGERTRLALACLVATGANVLLLDEPTNNLDPASRAEVLAALAGYRGAVVLVTHDDGAVAALAPERVLLLPDGVTDRWDDSLADLVALA